jgi:hypothetical protein
MPMVQDASRGALAKPGRHGWAQVDEGARVSNRLNQLNVDLTKADNRWRYDVGNPYIIAYTQAFSKYQETLARQKDDDKEAGELFVSAACLVTGSFLLGSIGKASLQMIAKRSVVQIANTTLFRNFSSVFRVARKNEGIAFAVGDFVDAAKDSIKSHAQTIATGFIQKMSATLSPEPLVQLANMDSFMRINVNCALAMGEMIDQGYGLSEADKDAAYATLRQAPFFGEPQRRKNKYAVDLPELIELSFYLSAVLDTDSLVTWPASVPMADPTGMAATRGAKSVPIGAYPTASNYPHPAPPRIGAFSTPSYQTVAIDRAGSQVQKRTNELCQKVFNKPLYSSGLLGLTGPADTLKGAELIEADKLLWQLSTIMKPMNPLDAIF